MARARPKLTPEASAEADAAFDWYLERSERSAESFLRELDRALSLIGQAAEIWPLYEAGARRLVMRRYPYSIIFRERSSVLEVIAVAHQSRRPGYWHGR